MRAPAVGAAAAAARVLIAGAEQQQGAWAAAPFGLSMFDALKSLNNVPATERDGHDDEQSPRPPPAHASHFDRMMVTMEERRGEGGTSSVIIGPSRESHQHDDINTNTSTGRCYTLPMARAAHDPSVLSTTCPTVTLAEANWYETNQPRKEYVQLGVVAAVSDPRGRILLTRRAAHMRSFPRAWVMPGGGLDEGESLSDCLVREVREETGVDVDRTTVSPFCLWESCYPTCGRECLEAESGITAHYLVVFCTAQTSEKNLSKLQQQVQLDEQETDMAVWIAADEVIRAVEHPLGGSDLGSVASAVPSSSSSKESDDGKHLSLDELAGIYPRGDDMKGIAQGNLFMLQELLQARGGGVFH